jgi:hypothetical protein
MVPVQVTGTSGGGLALESGNLSSIKTNTDGLKAAAAGAYVRQDSTATIAKESGGNLAALAATRVAVGSDTNPFALVVQGDTDGTPLPMTGSVIARLFDPTTATYFTIKDGNVLPLPTDHAVVVTLRDNPTIASITNPVAIKASVVDEGQPDYVADGSQQVLTQTIDGRLRVDTDKKLADSIEVLREELREMRTLFEMAFT